MDEALIDSINKWVKPNDQLYFLGDFCRRPREAGMYRRRLNVRKLYVCKGNHDKPSFANHVTDMWDMVTRKLRWSETSYKFHMCHFPIISWDRMYRGGIHVYGHGHGNYEEALNKIHPGRRAMEVSIDATYARTGEWRPVPLPEVLAVTTRGGPATLERGVRLDGPFEALRNDVEIANVIDDLETALAPNALPRSNGANRFLLNDALRVIKRLRA
jgi:calcineurin-like phosphoesterase family protein